MDEENRQTEALVKEYAEIEALGAEILAERSQVSIVLNTMSDVGPHPLQ